MPEIFHQTVSHQQRRTFSTLVFIYCWEMKRKHGRNVLSNNVSSTEKHSNNAWVPLSLIDGKETWQGCNIKQHHINPEGILPRLCSSIVERWKENMAELWHETTVHQERRISSTPVFIYCWKMERKHGRNMGWNNGASTKKDGKNNGIHLLRKDG